VGIRLKARKFKPVYTYAVNRHEALTIKVSIDSVLTLNHSVLADSVGNIVLIYKLKSFSSIYD